MAQSPTARITQAILGPGRRRDQFDVHVQERLDRAVRLNGLLIGRGWTLDPGLVDGELISWTWPPSEVEEIPDEHEAATTVTLNVEAMVTDVTRVGDPWDRTQRFNLSGLEAALEGLEAYRLVTSEPT